MVVELTKFCKNLSYFKTFSRDNLRNKDLIKVHKNLQNFSMEKRMFKLKNLKSKARPSLLCPINQQPSSSSSSSSPGVSTTLEASSNNTNNSSSTPTLRLGKERLKPFDFRSELSRQTPPSQLSSFSDNSAHSASSTPLFNMSDRYPTSSASSGGGGGGGGGTEREMMMPNNPVSLLNLPMSSRSSSASSVSLSSSTSSLAPMGRL